MTNEHAKEIIDFLVRKAGCDDTILANNTFKLENNTFHTFYVLQVRKSKTAYFMSLYYIMNSSMVENIEFSRKPAWKKILDRLLEISAKGLDILSYACNDMTFLKKNTSLEQIMVEMDLEASEND